jgi:hypothetical protein
MPPVQAGIEPSALPAFSAPIGVRVVPSLAASSGDRRHHVGGQQTQGQHCNCLTHGLLSFFKPNQKFTPKLRARKSRSVRVL